MIYYVTRDRVTTIFPLVADCFTVKNFAGILRPICMGIHLGFDSTFFCPAMYKQYVINVIICIPNWIRCPPLP